MVESISLNPNDANSDNQPPAVARRRFPSVRLTSEFDSDTSLFFHKLSCKLFDSVAKVKLGFKNSNRGSVSEPQLSFISKHMSCQYDFNQNNAIINGSLEIAPGLQLSVAHNVKAQVGQVSMVADLAPACKLELTSPFPYVVGLAQVGQVTMVAALAPACKLELTSPFPCVGLPKSTLRFPFGEVSLEKNEEQEVEEDTSRKKLTVSGIFKAQLLNGICNVQFRDDNLNLRYSYKDEYLTFIPSLSLPSNSLSCSFKRRFGSSDKLSYLYNFDTDYWSAVYKHMVGKDYKIKTGYDSKVRLGWASMWVGDENGKAKTAPMKMKVQLMVQVPQDDIRSSALIFRLKKRWDI